MTQFLSTRTLASLAAAGMLALAPMTVSAAPVLFSGTGNYYEVVVADGIGWAAANAAATGSSYLGLTGHLATIHSAAEDNFIHALILATPGFSSSGFLDSEAWIGAFASGPTTWTWVNGEGTFESTGGSSYSNWLGGEPNAAYGPGSEIYVAANLSGRFGWNDEGNLAGIYGYVVEYNAVPEPMTIVLVGLGLAGLGVTRRRQA